jgi:hypothetical protein
MNSVQELSEREQAIIKRCLEYVLRSGALSGEFETRMGVSERAVEDLLARWPQVGQVGDDSDHIAINNAMNEVVNGIHISDSGWSESFPWSLHEVAGALKHWRQLTAGTDNI